MEVSQHQVDLLAKWTIDVATHIRHHFKNGWLQLDKYELFFKELKGILHTQSYWNDEVKIIFNDTNDKKVHFKIYPTEKTEDNVITFERYAKNVWNYLNNITTENRNEQLSLF